MSKRVSAKMARSITLVGVAAALIAIFIPTIASSAPQHDSQGVHWGIITRNTIGSPVGDHRNGPYGSFGVTGSLARPPYGEGSLGIETKDGTEKVDFGNEVDFYGDNALGLNRLGFHVFQTGENVGYGGPRNMPNIRFEMDANLTNPACAADNYTTMVWVPDPSPQTDKWSGYIDATTTGNWYFTGAEATCTTCTDALNCTWTQAKAALNDGSPTPFIYTAMVGKGRDSQWIGAIDGLRINSSVFDFELDGVNERRCGGDGPFNC